MSCIYAFRCVAKLGVGPPLLAALRRLNLAATTAASWG